MSIRTRWGDFATLADWEALSNQEKVEANNRLNRVHDLQVRIAELRHDDRQVVEAWLRQQGAHDASLETLERLLTDALRLHGWEPI